MDWNSRGIDGGRLSVSGRYQPLYDSRIEEFESDDQRTHELLDEVGVFPRHLHLTLRNDPSATGGVPSWLTKRIPTIG